MVIKMKSLMKLINLFIPLTECSVITQLVSADLGVPILNSQRNTVSVGCTNTAKKRMKEVSANAQGSLTFQFKMPFNQQIIQISTIYQGIIKQDIICRCGESMDESQLSDEEGNDANQTTDEESKDEPKLSDEKPKDKTKSSVGVTQKTGVTGVTKTMKKNIANTKGTGTDGTQNPMKAKNTASSKAATGATKIPKGIYEKLLK